LIIITPIAVFSFRAAYYLMFGIAGVCVLFPFSIINFAMFCYTLGIYIDRKLFDPDAENKYRRYFNTRKVFYVF
jgi:hypothetical protein